MNDAVKGEVLQKIAPGVDAVWQWRETYRIGQTLVHTRFCSTDRNRSPKFKFNINPNTLRADFELWICGGANAFYLIPRSTMQEIYDNPTTYVDRHHPDIRVISLDVTSHRVTYASGGQSLDLSSCWNARLR